MALEREANKDVEHNNSNNRSVDNNQVQSTVLVSLLLWMKCLKYLITKIAQKKLAFDWKQ